MYQRYKCRCRHRHVHRVDEHDSPSLCVVSPCNQEQDADDPDQEAGLPGIGAANLAHFGNTLIPGPAPE